MSGTQLVNASKIGDYEKLVELLDQGVDANFRTSKYDTPCLQWASIFGHDSCVSLLLERGANIDALDYHGCSALIEASYRGHLNVVKILIERGADLNIEDEENSLTALDKAGFKGNLQICKLLLSSGSNMFNNYWFLHIKSYGVSAHPPISSEIAKLHHTELQKAWFEGPHPSQVKCRKRDRARRWKRRKSFLLVLAENGYRPLHKRIANASNTTTSSDELIIVITSRMEDVFRIDGLVRYIVDFL